MRHATIELLSARTADACPHDRRTAPLVHPSSQDPTTGHDPHRFLLLLRFTLLNVFAFALLGVAYAQGLVHTAVAADGTYLTVLILLVFLAGLALCTQQVWRTSSDLNAARVFDPVEPTEKTRYITKASTHDSDSRAILAAALRLKLSHRISAVRHVANSLVLLGLIGTVVGFVIALSGVDPDHASDIDRIAPMVSTLITGMSTALYTTLVGAIFHVWLMANHQLLAGGTVKLITTLVESAERHARA